MNEDGEAVFRCDGCNRLVASVRDDCLVLNLTHDGEAHEVKISLMVLSMLHHMERLNRIAEEGQPKWKAFEA